MKIWLYCSQEMSPAPLAPRSFLEVPVNSGGGVCWVVAEEGVPGKVGGRGMGVGTVEPVCFLCPPVHIMHMCVFCWMHASVCWDGGGADELQMQRERQQ